MTRFARHNRRLVVWLLALSLGVMALPSGASWQCLDGTPCPPDCWMRHAGGEATASCESAPAAHCAQCPTGTPAVAASPSREGLVCTSPQCVLRVSEKPASTLQSGVEIHAPLLALPPPPIYSEVVCSVEAETPVSAPAFLCFYPQRFLRPHSGRGPPVLLR